MLRRPLFLHARHALFVAVLVACRDDAPPPATTLPDCVPGRAIDGGAITVPEGASNSCEYTFTSMGATLTSGSCSIFSEATDLGEGVLSLDLSGSTTHYSPQREVDEFAFSIDSTDPKIQWPSLVGKSFRWPPSSSDPVQSSLSASMNYESSSMSFDCFFDSTNPSDNTVLSWELMVTSATPVCLDVDDLGATYYVVHGSSDIHCVGVRKQGQSRESLVVKVHVVF